MESQPQAGSWFEACAKGLDATQRDVLGLLALHGEVNISTLTELCNAAGLHATATRQWSTTSLRPHVEALVVAGVVRHGNSGFGVVRSAKHPALRDAAARGRLGALSQVAIANRFGRQYYGATADLALKALLELDVALALGGSGVDVALTRALDGAAVLGNVPSLEVAAHSVFPALVLSFERTWFERLDEGVQSRLCELAVSFAENAGSGLGELYGYALQRPRLFSSQPTTHAGLFGVAALAGDFETAGALAKSAQGDLRSTLLAALDVANGVFAAEHAFVPPKKDEPIGVARLLQGLLLLG